VSGNRLAALLGQSQPYWSWRLSGKIAFDVDDLAAVSGLLGVPMVRFFGGQDNLRPLGVAADRRAFRHCAPEGIRTPNLLIRR